MLRHAPALKNYGYIVSRRIARQFVNKKMVNQLRAVIVLGKVEKIILKLFKQLTAFPDKMHFL